MEKKRELLELYFFIMLYAKLCLMPINQPTSNSTGTLGIVG
jgi:hypothetical protein